MRAARTSPPARKASQIMVTARKRAVGESWSRLAATSQIRPMPTKPPPRYRQHPADGDARVAGRGPVAHRDALGLVVGDEAVGGPAGELGAQPGQLRGWDGARGDNRGVHTPSVAPQPRGVLSTWTQLVGDVGPRVAPGCAGVQARVVQQGGVEQPPARAAWRWRSWAASSRDGVRRPRAAAPSGRAGTTRDRQAARGGRAAGGPALQEKLGSRSTSSCWATRSPPGSALNDRSTPSVDASRAGSRGMPAAPCGCGPPPWWVPRAACSPHS